MGKKRILTLYYFLTPSAMRIFSTLWAFWKRQSEAMKNAPPYPLTWQEWQEEQLPEAPKSPFVAKRAQVAQKGWWQAQKPGLTGV